MKKVAKNVGVLAAGIFIGNLTKGLQDSKVIKKSTNLVEEAVYKGVEKVTKFVAGKKEEMPKKISTEQSLEKFEEFFYEVMKFNNEVGFGGGMENPENFTFTTYSEAKVKMLEHTLPEDLSPSQKKDVKELYSLIMDYGAYTERRLTKVKEEEATETIDIE